MQQNSQINKEKENSRLWYDKNSKLIKKMRLHEKIKQVKTQTLKPLWQ